MTSTTWQPDSRQIADPFGERAPLALSRRYRLLGADIEFRSDSAALLALVDSAYAGLPAPAPDGLALQVELRLTEGGTGFTGEPPEPRMLGGAGLLGVAMDAQHLALVNMAAGRALVQVSHGLLAHPYHLRYELIEFAVFTLAARTRGLLALHAGCVGLNGVGALLVGASGAGKSTLALQALAQGLDFLTEDASFVDPQTLKVSGIANFLHLRFDVGQWVDDAALRTRIEASPVIRRRSGVEKHELDLRDGWAPLAAQPLQLKHLVFAAPEAAADEALLKPLSAAELAERLHLSQPYAAGQPGWATFAGGCARLHGWELRRGSHPRVGALALKRLLMA
ncbi:hypothetical protein J2X20_004213 [Pelomonas saccharophila]|uniref:Serine kinase n=1 Tax=Roseateles saccharophilus TaxID=304 RepID=A0ABU1YRS7_ROSSA|nr:hypothetical protein [Roseateles saccharophilus]MDR7271545.1 hypothetical protein [Roseateles saccharophilus]